MQRPLKLLIAGLVIIAAFVGWMLLRPGDERVVMDLVAELPNAKERSPNAEAFSVIDATLAGEEHRAIAVTQSTRVKWDVTVPDNAWLGISLGLKPEAWTIKGDGVLFMIGVSDPAREGYQELLSLVVNPFGNEADRKWYPLMIDLSPYAGKTVEVILNTRAGAPGAPVDGNGDFALWGAPRILVR